jgi:hypothetical protein
MKSALNAGDRKADRFEAIVYELNGITYVPHYRNDSIFVGPGYPLHNQNRYSDVDLQVMGAQPKAMMLWPRGKNGAVSNSNP